MDKKYVFIILLFLISFVAFQLMNKKLGKINVNFENFSNEEPVIPTIQNLMKESDLDLYNSLLYNCEPKNYCKQCKKPPLYYRN